MSEKPARRRRTRLKVVGHIGTPLSVMTTLEEALVRAGADETLAIAIIEIQREGEILKTYVGHDTGFRRMLVAGASYLLDDLKDET